MDINGRPCSRGLGESNMLAYAQGLQHFNKDSKAYEIGFFTEEVRTETASIAIRMMRTLLSGTDLARSTGIGFVFQSRTGARVSVFSVADSFTC
jgi:hypothetical protein